MRWKRSGPEGKVMQKEEMIKRKREELLSGIPASMGASRQDLKLRMSSALTLGTVSDNPGASGKP